MRKLKLGQVLVLAVGAAFLTTGANSAGLADPTRPPQTRAAPSKPVPSEPLTLDFVVRSRDRHLARINGTWVSEGETVAGARVERIEAHRVLVRRGDRTLILRLGGEGIQKKKTDR